jgi:hypothetical protein
MHDAKTEFLRAYSNLPMSTREETIVVIEGKPISWNVAYIEVSGNTQTGIKIIEQLVRMNILGCEK